MSVSEDDSQYEGEQEARQRRVRTAIFVGSGILLAVIFLAVVVYLALPDTWERDNATRVLAALADAAATEAKDPVRAYTAYSELLAEASRHKIKDTHFKQQLEKAVEARERLRPAAEAALARQRVEEARRKEQERKEEEEAKRIEAERARKEAEARAEDARIEGERARREKSHPEYMRKTQAFYDSLLRINSDLQVGINSPSYSERCREANFQYNKWVPALTREEMLHPSAALLEATLQRYLIAMNYWDKSIHGPDYERELRKLEMQREWSRATALLDLVKACMSSRDVVRTGPCVLCLGKGRLGETEGKVECKLCAGTGQFPRK